MSYPLISVLMPAYNAEQYIKEALDSIFATDYPNLDVIVVNDGSTDDTAKIVEEYPAKIRLYHQENQGIPITRNRTLDLVQGDLFTFLDADDWWLPHKLKVQLPLMDTAEITLGHSRKILDQAPWLSLLLSSGLFQRSIIEKVGYFDLNFPGYEDRDWMYRAWEVDCHIVHHNNVVHVYRRHDNNSTHDIEKVHKHNLKLLKVSLDRRRKMNNPKKGNFTSHFVETPPDEHFLGKPTNNE